MKKILILFIMFLIVGFGFTCGYYLYKVPDIERQQAEAKANTDIISNSDLSNQTKIALVRP